LHVGSCVGRVQVQGFNTYNNNENGIRLILGIIVITFQCKESGKANNESSKKTSIDKEKEIPFIDSLENPLSGNKLLEKNPNEGNLCGSFYTIYEKLIFFFGIPVEKYCVRLNNRK
jgi:hypothetical protein